MPKYRKKPVVVEAIQFTGSYESYRNIANAFGGVSYHPWKSPNLMVWTPEGTMEARPGDYIVRGVAGEVYPVKREIFEATYEPVEC